MNNQERRALGTVLNPCVHCGQTLTLGRWDSWNGFLVRCPNCHGLHGKRWSIRGLMFASLLFNALSFLFTMKPRNAVLSVAGFAILALVGNFILLDKVSDTMGLLGASIFILAPMAINAVILLKRHNDLDNSAPVFDDLRPKPARPPLS